MGIWNHMESYGITENFMIRHLKNHQRITGKSPVFAISEFPCAKFKNLHWFRGRQLQKEQEDQKRLAQVPGKSQGFSQP